MDPIQALRLQANQQGTNFPANSRYHQVETLQTLDASGEEIVYLKRRFIPPAKGFTTLRKHRVVQGERLDNLTNEYLKDSELFWRVCDANDAMHPLELTEETGRVLHFTLPAGL